MDEDKQSPWFLPVRHSPQASARLFAFPYAGAAAQAFRGFGAGLNAEVAAYALQLPGRAARSDEPAIEDIAVLIDQLLPEILPMLDRPAVFFGYSNGALIAYELIRRLQHCGCHAVRHLVVAARRSPILPSSMPRVSTLTDDELVQRLAEFNGMPVDVLANPPLLAGLLPRLRADFLLGETCEALDYTRLNISIDAFFGGDDALAGEADMSSWAEMTSANFALTRFEGDHFFVNSHTQSLVDRIVRIVEPYRSAKLIGA